MVEKYTIEKVKSFIEENSGSKLLSTEYINTSSNLKLLCSCGDVFYVSNARFRRGKTMCNKCTKKISDKKIKPKHIRWNYEKAKEYIESKGCKLVSDEYVNVDSDLIVKCRDCGEEYSVTLYAFNKNKKHTCNKCSYQRTADGQKLSYKHVKSVVERDGCLLISKTYERIGDRLTIKCKCGNVFENSLAEVKAKDIRQCPDCGNKLKNAKRKISYEEMVEYIEDNSFCRMVSKECNDIRDDIDVLCGCGDIFTTTFFRFKHNNKRQCDKCGGRIKWDIDLVRDYVNENSDCKLISTEYINTDTLMEFQCACGDIFSTSFDKFKGSRGKQYCNECSNRSRLEGRSVDFFKSNNIKYESEKTFDGCINPNTNYLLRYDFYLPEYNTLIECDGIQHFEPIRFFNAITDEEAEIKFKDQQYKDNIKNQYALQNNIKLIRIPYWELDNIENILNETIKILKQDNLKECV